MKRTVIIALVIILLLCGGAVAYLALTFQPDEYRSTIEKALSERVGRKVSLGELSLSLLGGVGIEVKGFQVVGDRRNPEEAPVVFNRGKLKLAILPLFAKKVRVKEVVLDAPKIFLRKYRDGTLSVDDIFMALRRGEKKKLSPKEEGKKSIPIDIEVKSVVVKGGSITYISEEERETKVVSISPVTLEVDNLGFGKESSLSVLLKGSRPFEFAISYRGKARVEPSREGIGTVTFELEGETAGFPTRISGEVLFRGRETEFQCFVSSDGVSPKVMADIYRALTGKKVPVRSEGKGKISFAAGGTTKEFGFELDLDLTRVALFYGDFFKKFSDQDLGLIVQGRYIKPKVYISNGELRVPNLLSSVNAELDVSRKEYVFSCSFDVGKIRNLFQYFPTIEQYHATGGVTASVTIGGTGKKWKLLSGAADLKEIHFDLVEPPLHLRNVSGHVEVKGNEIVLNPLSALVNGQRLTLSGHGEKGKQIKGIFSLTANYLDLDSLLSRLEKKGGKEKKKPVKGGGKPFIEKLDIAVNMKLKGAKVRGAEVKDLEGLVRVDRGKVVWENAGWTMLGGNFKTEGDVVLTGVSRPLNFSLFTKDVSVFDFLKKFTSLGGVLDGALSLELQGRGDISSLSGLRQTLEGKGVVRLTKGKVLNVDVVHDVLSLLGAVTSQRKVRKVRKVTDFEEVVAPFTISGGNVVSKNFRVKGKDFALVGRAELDSSNRFEFDGEVKLPASFAKKFTSSVFKRRKDGIYIPVKIVGPLNGLAMTLKPSKIIEKKGKEILENIIKEKLFK